MTGGHRPWEEEKKKGGTNGFAATQPAPGHVRSERGGRAESWPIVLTKRKHNGNDLRWEGNIVDLLSRTKRERQEYQKMRVKPR